MVEPDLLAAPACDVQATFCATLVDEWVARGVRHGVIAPGSRSTPMALALTARSEIEVHVVHDERVAAFVALGLGVDGAPALVLCTSGTAAANFFPAVVEAGLSQVPLIVLTADRPDELRGVGAPQTIDQIDLYGRHVVWSHDAEVAQAHNAASWRQLAADARRHAASGPVQLNLAFREPLLGTPLALPSSPVPEASQPPPITGDPVPVEVRAGRGLILVGSAHGIAHSAVLALAEQTGWPVVADPLSGMRQHSIAPSVDSILRVAKVADAQVPDVIVRVGRPSTSKVLAQWSTRSPLLIQVGGPGRIDPDHNVAATCQIDDVISSTVQMNVDVAWQQSWRALEQRASAAIDAELDRSPLLTEPGAARIVADHLPAGATLTVSSSMPVRDLEWFGGANAIAHCNRGANGIDGVLSTALGRGLGSPRRPGVVLIGDLAFAHDSNALLSLAGRGADLRVVVVDNDGGGIFSFLPQAESLAAERFETLFGTPLSLDVLALAQAHGLPTATAVTADELAEQLQQRGPWVCRVPSQRAANVDVHAALHAAVAAALDTLDA